MDPTIPFLDLPAQQRRIAGPLRARLDRVLAHCQFVLGPEVAELEAALAARAGAARGVWTARTAAAMSSGVPARPTGISAAAWATKSSNDTPIRSAVARVMSVAMKPGAMALAVTP